MLTELFEGLSQRRAIERRVTKIVEEPPTASHILEADPTLNEIEKVKDIKNFHISETNGIAHLLRDAALARKPDNPTSADLARQLWINKGAIPFNQKYAGLLLRGIIELHDEDGMLLTTDNAGYPKTIVSPPIQEAFEDFKKLPEELQRAKLTTSPAPDTSR